MADNVMSGFHLFLNRRFMLAALHAVGTAGVELTITLESFGTEHKDQIIKALETAGYCPVISKTSGIYM